MTNDKHSKSFRCVLHGSFRKHFAEIGRIRRLFADAGIEVLAPAAADMAAEEGGFVFLNGEEGKDKRLVELLYLHHLKRLGRNGFSYFVNPEGYIGKSASYELGIVQLTNTRCFFLAPLADHPAYVHRNAVWPPELLAEYIAERHALPEPQVEANEAAIHVLWEELMVPGSVVAAGPMIEYADRDAKEKEVLLVRTHKWGGRWSMVGGKVRRNERLDETLLRELREETGLSGCVGEHLCTFDQVENSGYYMPGIQHIFVDKVVRVESRAVRLNDEAEKFAWVRPKEALRFLDIEPNARKTLALYERMISCAFQHTA